MAIIRKGDKVAEAALRKEAVKQASARKKASPNERERAGLKRAGNIMIDTKTKKAYTRELGNSVTGNAFGVVRKDASGPISGSSVGAASRADKSRKMMSNSGVIKAGKVVKGQVKKKGK
jgi:hypothetical protein